MAVTIKHAKTDTIADWTQADLDAQIAAGNYPAGTVLADIVLPSDWNNDHTVTGLGTMATQDANNVSITGGSISGATVSGYIPTTQKGVANGVATLDAGGKVPTSQIPALGDLNYQGTWDASTNTPTLTSSVGTKGYYYVVNVAGSTNLNGITDWQVGDWAVYNGSAWEKIDNTQAYPAAGIANSTGSSWGTSYSTTGSGTVVALATNPTLANPNIDVVDFDTTYATTLTAGQLGWDGNNTLGLGMIGGNVIQHIGEDSFIYIKASSAITKGQVVMFTGAVGASAVPTGAPATGITDGTYIMGIAAESLATNGFGLVQCFGTLRNVNTTGYVDGDILWYNPAVTGGLTKTTPSAPNVKVQVAAVLNGGSAGGGSILIRVNAGSQLGGTDSNVQINGVVNGQILTYDGTNAYWKNTTPVAGTGITLSSSATGVLTVTNSLPDQTVAITGSGGAVVTGTYPNFTITTPSGTVTSVTGTAPISSTGGATPAISISQATTSTNGYLSSTDWNTFNGKQTAYTNLTTFGSLANATGWLYNNGTGTLSYSTPTAAQVGAVPTTRSLTINGTAYDLSADRTWSVGTVTSVAALTLGTSGTDLSSTVATGTTTPVITLNVPTASATNRGALSAADWTTFNSKGSGSVTTVSVASANGFAGTVANASTTPAITLTTSISGMLKGNGTAISAGTAGTDYVAPATATNFTAQQYFGNVALTDAATISWAANTQQVATFTFVSSNRTMGAPTGLVSGAFYALAVIQNAGSNTLTWNSVFKWTGGTAPTLSTAAGAKDYFVFRSDGTNLYEQGRSLGVA